MNLNGNPHNEFEVVDTTTPQVSALIKGAVCLLIVTERGDGETKPRLIQTPTEYRKWFGSILPVASALGPYLADRALRKKTPLYIWPARHYEDATDASTVTGIRGTLQIGIAEIKAIAEITITTAADGDAITVKVDSVTIGTYTVGSGGGTVGMATGLRTAINAATNTNGGFTAIAGTTTSKVKIVAPTGSGAAANSYVITYTLGATAAVTTTTPFAGGVTNHNSLWEATSSGPWSTGKLGVAIAAAASGDTSKVDISISLTGFSELNKTFPGIPIAPTSADLLSLNQKIGKHIIQFKQFNGASTFVVGTATAAGGVRDISEIVTDDYIGAPTALTGIYAFNPITTASKICAPEIAEPLLDIALANYCDARKDIHFVIRTPIGLDGDTVADYRQGTGDYSHTPINSWRGIMTTGGIVSFDVDNNEVEHPESLDACSCMSARDQANIPWKSFAGPQRGIVSDADRVIVDFSSTGRESEWTKIDANGVIPIVMADGKATFTGDNNLWGEETLIKSAGVAETVTYLYRLIKPKVNFQSFEPTHPITFRALYRDILPILKQAVADGAILDYRYYGDQGITVIEDVKVNSLEDLSEGRYIVKIFVKVPRPIKWIGLQLNLVDLSVDLDIILNDPNQ